MVGEAHYAFPCPPPVAPLWQCIDGARFLPDNVTLSKAVAKAFTPSYGLIGGPFEAPPADLNAPIINPTFSASVRYLPDTAGGAGDDDEAASATGVRVIRFSGKLDLPVGNIQ